MTFLPFLLNRSRLPICSYNLFLFWPVTLKSVKKKKSIYACILIHKISTINTKKKKKCLYIVIDKKKKKKKKKKKYLCMYIDKQNQLKKKKVLFFSIL